MVHHGKNIMRIRLMLQRSQEGLANALGISQQAVSQMEQKETVDLDTIERVAIELGCAVGAITQQNEEAFQNIGCNFYSYDTSAPVVGIQNNNGEVDKILKVFQELLQVEREKSKLLEDLVKELRSKK